LATDIRANLPPLPRAFIERATAGFGGYAGFFRGDMPPIFAQLTDETQKRELTEATASARAMDDLTAGSDRSARPPMRSRSAAEILRMLRTTESRSAARGTRAGRHRISSAISPHSPDLRRVCAKARSPIAWENARQQAGSVRSMAPASRWSSCASSSSITSS
jgi:hypothetical protein